MKQKYKFLVLVIGMIILIIIGFYSFSGNNKYDDFGYITIPMMAFCFYLNNYTTLFLEKMRLIKIKYIH